MNPLKEFALLSAAVVAGVLLITVILVYALDYVAEYIPFEFEEAIAQSVVEKTNKPPNEVDEYLQSLANKITAKMDLPAGMNITLHYVNQGVVNAMATIGGHVFVYRGMLEKLPHENALMMLLGHEIAHVKLRHPVKALGKGVVMALLFSSVTGQSSDVAAEAVTDISLLTLLSFSRDQEEVSDEVGIKAVRAVYGHVQGASELFEVLKAEQKNSGMDTPQFLNSHPDTESRIGHLNDLVLYNNWQQQGKLVLIPESIHQKLKLDRDKDSED